MIATMERSAVAVARKHISVCVLDQEPAYLGPATMRLEEAGFSAAGTTSPQEALQKIRLGECRVVLADFKMPEMDGLAFLEKALQFDPGIYVILVTGIYSVDSAINAIKRGAYDYLCKPLDYPRLEKTLDELADIFAQRSEIRDLKPSSSKICNLKESWEESRHDRGVRTGRKSGAALLQRSDHWAHRRRARNSSRAHCTSSVPYRSNASRFATARRLSTLCSKASFSGMCAALSRAQTKRVRDFSNTRTAELSFWTKLAKHLSPCRRSSCA